MTTFVAHGGGCCGMRHIYNFDRRTTEADIVQAIARTAQHRTQGMIIEAVLTNYQCKAYPNIPVMLQRKGFKLVNRFKNPNSGNICNVFHYNKVPRSLTSRLPFPIVEADTEV